MFCCQNHQAETFFQDLCCTVLGYLHQSALKNLNNNICCCSPHSKILHGIPGLPYHCRPGSRPLRIHKGPGSQTEPTRQHNTGLTPCPCVKLSRIHSRTRESSQTVTQIRTDCCTDRLYNEPPHSVPVPAH